MRTLFCLLILSSKLLALPCDVERGSWGIAGEWLYFMPSFDQSEYFWEGTVTPAPFPPISTTRLGEKQTFDSGFRVEAFYRFRCCDNSLALRYTHFDQNFSRFSQSNPALQILGIGTDAVLDNTEVNGNVFYDRAYRYYNIEGLFGLLETEQCRFCSTFSAGVKFIHLHIKQKANYFNIPNSLRQFVEPDMLAWALGPTGAFDASFCLTKCFNLLGRAQLGLLSSQTHSKMTITGSPGGNSTAKLLIENEPNYWHIITSLDARIGADYQHAFTIPCHFNFCLEGGYEWMNERRIVDRISRTATLGGFSFNEWSDFTLQGPYVRLNLTY